MYNYQDLLNADEWKNFSNEILKRDNYTCQICHKKGFRNGLFVPITSLNEVLDFFADYRFDGKTLQDVLYEEKNRESKEYYFKPTKYNNIYRPLIEQKYNQTAYQHGVECLEYGDMRFYCDHIPQEKVLFHHKPLYYRLMAHKDFDATTHKPLIGKEYNIPMGVAFTLKLQSLLKDEDDILNTNSYPLDEQILLEKSSNELNHDFYAAGFVIDHFCRTSNNIEGGYIQVIDYGEREWVKIVTNEFFIFIDLVGDGKIKFFPKLNVHHTFYYYGNTLPWGYYWKDLVTLCQDCHHHLHEKDEVPIYDVNMRKINDELETCDRCGGTGFLPQYNHVQNGICFKCHGTRKIFMK